MNIQERIEALETEFAEKIKTLKAEVQREQEFPQDGDEYWHIDSDGDVLNDEWGAFASEEGMLEIGNIFQTREQAEFAVEKLKVEAELRKFSKPFKEYENNYFIQINSSHNNIVVDSDDCYQTQGTIYFESKFEAHDVIQTVGEDRIKKYLFGVED